MAERKPYGQEYADAMKRGLVSLYENENVQDFGRGLINNPLSKGITNYIIDPVAELGTRAASAKGIFPFLPDTSILTALTPEVTADRETRESIDADITQYPTMGERLEKRMDRFRADVGAFGEFLFGDVRNAGENLNKGVKFADLPPEQKLAARFFLLDIIPIPGVGPAAKAGARATKELENLKSQMVTSRTTTKSGGAADTIGEMTEQVRNKVGPISTEELAYLSNVFVNMPPSHRLSIKKALTNDEFDTLLEFTKNKLKPGVGLGNRKMSIIEQDGVSGIMYGRTQDKKRFVPLSNLNLKLRPPGPESSSKAGGFQFTLKEGEQIKTRTDTQKEGLLGGQKVLRDIEAKENKIIQELFPKLKAEGKKMGMSDNPQPDTIFGIIRDRLGTDRVGNKLLSRKGFREKLQKLGLYETADKSDDVTRQQLIEGVAGLTDDKVKSVIPSTGKTKTSLGISDPFVRSLGDEFKTVSDVNNFLRSVDVEDVTDLKSLTPDNPKLYDLLENYRVEAQDFLNTNPKFQNYFKNLGETDNIVLHRAHSDRSISPSNQSQQFQGLDATNVKILGQNVNVILQPDLEVALFKKIKAKDVDGTEEIIDTMKDFFIGTKLNDPRRANLTKDDYKWLEKNGIVKIPTISVGAGRPYKNTDAIIFGTEQQPNLSEIVGGELAARQYFRNKTAFEKNYGLKYVDTMNKGGIVNAADVQYAAPGGFFSKMFGKPPPYLKEEIAKTDIFSPTQKQQAALTALGPEATAINPGQVFYSNLELSLSKPNSPVKFDSEKEFYDYINAAGIGRDEVSDARIAPYISAKAKSGEPILSEDIIQITSESPLNQLTTEGFGFRSDKINIAKSDIPERYDAPAIERGQPVFKEAKYAGTGLMPGFIPGSYRERVLKIDSDKFRGDPGTLPSGASGHNFGDNYTLAWGRATDRPAIINQGEVVDKASGEIINPLAVTDTKKLQDIEAKIQSLVDDPLTNVDPDDFQTISQAVNALVERSGGRLTYDKAKQAVDAQIVQKQKQLRKLQSQFVEEEKRLESIKDVKPQNVTMTFIDEIQSDIAQAATRKARELAIKLDVMAEQGIGVEAMEQGINRDLMQFFADNRSVARPVGATKLELMPQYNELMAFQKQFSEMAKKPPYALAPQDFAMYENFKKRQTEIIDSMADEISGQLMKALYPDVPLKDRGAWSDAVLKQQLYEAAHRLFVEKDPKAPTYLGVASGDIVAGKAYNQAGDTSMDINERILDKQNRINKYKDNLRRDINTTASLGSSQYPGVGTHEFYGGPKSRAWNEETNKVGGHYTSDIERSMRKYADDNNSKMVVANVAVSDARGGTVYNILNQETGEIMGQGDTYRQAENIANQLVDEDGGRYKIQKSKEKNFDTEPVFAIELTKEMLQLNKIYK